MGGGLLEEIGQRGRERRAVGGGSEREGKQSSRRRRSGRGKRAVGGVGG
jgi:hypothetical protein